MALLQVECRQYRSHKHTLFGLQEGKCKGCDVLFRFRNMTIDHIHPRSRGERVDVAVATHLFRFSIGEAIGCSQNPRCLHPLRRR